MGRVACLVTLRILALFLALEVADTPLFCFDEQPGVTGGGTLGVTSHSGDGGTADLNQSVSSQAAASDSCFCPCHFSFESEARFAFFSSSEFVGSPAPLILKTPPAPSADVDHPPQNLA